MKKTNPTQIDPNKIIDALGGTFRVAELCEVTPGAVSQWRNNGIPRGSRLFLRERYRSLFRGKTKKDGEVL